MPARFSSQGWSTSVRIERLSLDPFGSFEGRHLAFRLERRFHLVLGDNEAGKSTTLRALMALLYGLGGFSSDTDGPGKARVEGRFLTDAGTPLAFARTKKGRKDEAIDPGGNVVPEAELDALRGDVDLDTFRSTHGLTLAALQQGSREMLAAKDDVGATLLQARFGKLDIPATAADLENEQKDIFAPRGKKADRKLARALEAYRQAKADAEIATSSPQALEDQRKRLAEAEAELDNLRREFESVRAELDRSHAIRRSADRVEKRRHLSLLLGELGEHGLGADEANRILGAANAVAKGHATRQLKIAERDQAERDLLRLPSRDAILDFRTELEWLERAEKDDRSDEIELARLQARTKELDDASIEGPADVLARTHGDIAQLLDDANAIVVRVQTAKTKQELALKELADIEEGLAQARTENERRNDGSPEVDEALLADVLRDLERGVELEDAAKLAESTQRARLKARLDEKSRSEALTDEAFVAFARLVPPFATVDASCASIARLREQATQVAEELTRLAEEADEIAQRRTLLSQGQSLPTDDELRNARSSRQEALSALKVEPTAPKVDALAQAIEVADGIVDRLRAHASLVSERSHLDAALAALSMRSERLRADHERHVQERRRLEAALTRLFPPSCAHESAETLREWARWAEEVRPLAMAFGEAVATTEHHTQKRTALETTLAKLLGRAERGETLLREGKRALELEQKRATAKQQASLRMASLEAALATRTRDLLTLEAERKEASAKWQSLAAPHGLPTNESDGRSIIASALKARENIVRRESLLADARRLEDRRLAFRERLAKIAASIASGSVETGVPLSELVARLARADAVEATRREYTRIFESAELELQTQQKVLAWAEDELEGAKARLATPRTDELVGLAERSKRRKELEVELRVLDGELSHLGTVSAEDVARAETDAPRLKARFEQIGDELQKAERLTADIRHGVERFQQVNDGAAEALALAETHRAEARALARQWAVSALATQMLRDAMANLRKEAEGPVFEKASAFIAQMTGGRYVRLRVELGQAKEQAIFLETSAGHPVSIDRLSDGTRDQLYLAVRLAFLVLQRETGGPELPLLLDDVLTAFDDKRAKATLELLLSLGEKLEIFYFSHHERILELLAECVPAGDLDASVDVLRLVRAS